MLARLTSLDGVIAAEVDHRGELLRLLVSGPSALARIHAALRELGYRADEVGEAPSPDSRWYGPARVNELSREEVDVIARRVVPPFARSQALSTAVQDRVREAVANALYACFTAHTLGAGAPPGELHGACSNAVREAVRDLVGPHAADRLVATLWLDLDESQPSGAEPG